MKQQGMSFTDPRELKDDGLNKFLGSINWETDKEFSDKELKEIFVDALRKYFSGEASQDFIIGLADKFYGEMSGRDDEDMWGATCEISELGYERINGKKVSYSKEQIDEIFQKSLQLLADK